MCLFLIMSLCIVPQVSHYASSAPSFASGAPPRSVHYFGFFSLCFFLLYNFFPAATQKAYQGHAQKHLDSEQLNKLLLKKVQFLFI